MPRVLKIDKQSIEIGMDNGKIYTFDRRCCKQIVQVGDTVQIYGQNPNFIIMVQTTPESRAINRIANIIREIFASSLILMLVNLLGALFIATLGIIGTVVIGIVDVLIIVRLISTIYNT